MAAKFVVKLSSNGQAYFRLQAGNGETILKSEMYNAKASAMNGIESVRTHAPSDERYERKDAAGEQFMFNLKASNGQVIGTSEVYTTVASRDAGIASVKTNATVAVIDDQTD